MKKIILLLYILLLSFSANAQKFSWGPKISISSPTLKLSDLALNATQDQAVSLLEQSNPSIGFQLGIYSRASFLGFYIQPEILLSNSRSEINYTDLTDLDNPLDLVGDVKLNKLDVPVLFGKRFFKILRVNAGPVFTLLLSQNIEQGSNTAKEIETNYKDSTVGAQLGIGLDLALVTIDLRYEIALQNISDGLAIGDTQFVADQRLNQILLSLGMKF
tara:strand:- start:1529 stop:2179 length:651 start_codon:yes stop_codon:yes gene_type:complete